MALFRFQTLTDGQPIAFNPSTDELLFDGPGQTAGLLRLEQSGNDLVVSLGAKSIILSGVQIETLRIASGATAPSIRFADGSLVIIGDGTTGRRADIYGQSMDLSGTSLGHYLDGRGGADLIIGGSGADWIVGNTPPVGPTALTHVSQVAGTGSPTASGAPSISGDGSLVAFTGAWTGFGSSSDSVTDIVIKNIVTGEVAVKNVKPSGLPVVSGAGSPVFSADGRFVAFQSADDLLGEGATNPGIYRASATGSGLEAVSKTGSSWLNGESRNADMSADGRYVVFESRATNGGPGGEGNYYDIFLKDMQTGTLTRVSTSMTGTDGDLDSRNARISADGRYVVFESQATNLTTDRTGFFSSDIYLWDRLSGSLTNITAGLGGRFNASAPDIARDTAGGIVYGGTIVFHTEKALVPEDTNNTIDVYAYDMASRSFTRLSVREDGGQVFSPSQNARISDDGRFVVFRSFADGLVDGDTNGVADIFVRDLVTGELRRVSNPPGGQGNQNAVGEVAISAGGEWIVFASLASNLAGTDANGTGSDVFRVLNPLFRDVLRGGPGDDTYVIDRPDTVFENPDEGIDTVRASITYTLPDNVENLQLTGLRNINGTGNTLGNHIIGNSGNNRLRGLDGDDTLDGGSGGNDTLEGGEGSDTYIVDRTTGITIVETGRTGIDTVRSSVTWTLGDGLENLVLTGTANRNGTGNALNNVLTGNSGNNRLRGLAGDDTLHGGSGGKLGSPEARVPGLS
ncbi:MAG: hypothetical protein ACK4KW_13450 [Gemmobacter sp.]